MDFIPVYRRDWTGNQARYFLNHWYAYDQRINDLNEFNRTCLIQFYIRLSYLTDDERNFLAAHYHHPLTDKQTDKHRALECGMTTKEYTKQRTAIVNLLRPYRGQPANNARTAELQKLVRSMVDRIPC